MKFIAITSFTNYIDAHIILGRMKEEGVHCWLKNENINTIIPIWTHTTGSIQLMVHKDHWHKASFLLKETGRNNNQYLTLLQ